MKIEFNSVLPHPMVDDNFSDNSIWKNHCILDSESNYFISSDSGKGKSTFLSYIFGLRNDFTGKITIDNQEITSFDDTQWSELRKNKLSILMQDLRLFPHLSVWENLLLKNNLTDHKTEEEILSMIQLFSLENKKDQLAGKLSLGQQQRIALIRSLLQPFDFILLDEPFSNIDDNNIEIAKRLILDECNKNNGSFIITTLGYDYKMENVVTINL